MESPVTARVALLQALFDAPGHGHALIARVYAKTGGRLALGTGSVYPQLKLMAADGLVTSTDEPALRGVRHVYRLTPKGRRAHKEACAIILALFSQCEVAEVAQ